MSTLIDNSKPSDLFLPPLDGILNTSLVTKSFIAHSSQNSLASFAETENDINALLKYTPAEVDFWLAFWNAVFYPLKLTGDVMLAFFLGIASLFTSQTDGKEIKQDLKEIDSFTVSRDSVLRLLNQLLSETPVIPVPPRNKKILGNGKSDLPVPLPPVAEPPKPVALAISEQENAPSAEVKTAFAAVFAELSERVASKVSEEEKASSSETRVGDSAALVALPAEPPQNMTSEVSEEQNTSASETRLRDSASAPLSPDAGLSQMVGFQETESQLAEQSATRSSGENEDSDESIVSRSEAGVGVKHKRGRSHSLGSSREWEKISNASILQILSLDKPKTSKPVFSPIKTQPFQRQDETDLSTTQILHLTSDIPRQNREIIDEDDFLILNKEHEGNHYLLSYINTLYKTQAVGIENDAMIQFCDSSNGKSEIVRAGFQKNDISQVNQQKDQFFAFVAKTYGKRLSDTVRDKLSLPEQTPLTFGILKSAFIIIGANVCEQDLRDLFDQIKQGSHRPELGMLCMKYLSSRAMSSISSCERFEELAPFQIKLLMDTYRTVPIGGRQKPIMEAFFPGISPKDMSWINDSVRNEAIVLHQFEMLKGFNVAEPHLVASEHLSKEIIYSDLHPGMIIPLVDNKGELCYLKVQGVLQKDPINFAIMMPLNKSSEASAENPLDIHLAFRGTDSTKGWVANTQLQGVGKAEFEESKEAIFNLVKSALEGTSFVRINLHGHSLGGAFKQRALCAFVDELANNDSPAFSKIVHISACSGNSPNIEPELNRQFKINLDRLEFKQTLARLKDNKPEISINLDYCRFEGRYGNDIVQVLAGGLFIGYHIRSNLLKRRAIIHSNQSVGFLEIHAVKPRHLNEKSFNVLILDESHPESLDQILGCGWAWEDPRNFQEAFLKYALWYGGYALSAAKMAPQILTHGTLVTMANVIRLTRFLRRSVSSPEISEPA